MTLTHREYGTSGRQVVLLHGGPGAAGYLAGLAHGLEQRFLVLEPFQRGSGGELLTVRRHVEDLRVFLESHCPDEPPAIVGHSWGAMLALAFAADHPTRARSIVLVGCGTFDPVARRRFQERLHEQLDTETRERLQALAEDVPCPNERLAATGRLLMRAFTVSAAPSALGELLLARCDARANEETWQDMLLRQEDGTYPAAFSAITVPVLMLHGEADPHPGKLIRADLAAHMPQLEFEAYPRCGHYPWVEIAARDAFFTTLRGWLAR